MCIGLGAAIENFIPPVPADTFVLFGAFLAAAGRANVWAVFLVTWISNVLSALLIYGLARRYGDTFFESRIGSKLLDRHQLDRIGVFYERWGVPAIAFSRFLPAFRAFVPIFGGVSRVPLWKLTPPLALASAVWYGALVFMGAKAGNNFDAVVALFEKYSLVLLAIACALFFGFVVWWVRSRRGRDRS